MKVKLLLVIPRTTIYIKYSIYVAFIRNSCIKVLFIGREAFLGVRTGWHWKTTRRIKGMWWHNVPRQTICSKSKVVAFDIRPALKHTCLLEMVYNFSFNFPSKSLHNGVSHHFEVNGNSVTSKQSTLGWWSFIPVLPTFTGTIYTPWSSEVVIYWDTAQHPYPPENLTPACRGMAGTMTTQPPWFTF